MITAPDLSSEPEIDYSTGEITVFQPMTEDEARRVVGRINQLAHHIGRMLIELKVREGWRALGYGSWTAFLESDELEYSRKRLYEFMRAAPIQELLVTKGYGEVPTAHAKALSQFPTELQVPIYETVVNHGKPVTVERIEAQGRVLTELVVTGGFVTTASGEQSSAQSAYNAERREQEIAKKQPLLDTSADISRRYTQEDGDFITLKLPRGMAAKVNNAHKVRIVVYEVAA